MRFPLAIAASIIGAYALAFALTIPANPEVRFWTEVVKKRDRDIAEVRAENPDTPVIFFTGGSSCAFSIDPSVIEEATGFPTFNLGLPVAAGTHYILHQALSRCKPGDFLIMALEPDLLLYPEEDPSTSRLAFALATQQGMPFQAAGGATFGRSVPIPDWLSNTRPGSRYLMTLLGRTLGGKGYRYKPEDIQYHGHIVTPVIDPDHSPSPKRSHVELNPIGRAILETLKTKADAQGVRIAYAMPWRLTQTSALNHNRAAHRKTLDHLATILPVIRDGTDGSIDDARLYSDSEWHLTAEGARQRTQALANPLNDWIKNGSL